MNIQRIGIALLAPLLLVAVIDDYRVRSELQDANQEIDFLRHGKDRLIARVTSSLQTGELDDAKMALTEISNKFPAFEASDQFGEFSKTLLAQEEERDEQLEQERIKREAERHRAEVISVSEGVFGFSTIPVALTSLDMSISASDSGALFSLLSKLEIPGKDDFEKKSQYLLRLERYLSVYEIGRYARSMFFLLDATADYGVRVGYDAETEFITVHWDANVDLHSEEEVSYYPAQNVLGVAKTVTKTSRDIIAFDARSFPAKNVDLQKGYDLPDIRISAAPENAEILLPNIRVIYAVSFDQPVDEGWNKYSSEPSMRWTSRKGVNSVKPTIKYPTEFIDVRNTMYGKLHEVLVVDAVTGKILGHKTITY